MTQSAAVASEWLEALERVVLIPAEARERTVPAAEAARMLDCPVAVVDALVDAGLPVVGRDGGGAPLLDMHDVINVGLEAAAGRSIGVIGAQVLLRYAASPPESWTAPRRWDVAHEYACDARCDASAWDVARPALDAFGGHVESWHVERAVEGGARVTVRGRIATAGRAAAVADERIVEAYRAALADLQAGRVRYHWLPSGLRHDGRTLARLGAGDCATSSLALAGELERAGVEARTRTVTALGVAGVDHAWTEARDRDGDWKPLDPVFAYLARRLGLAGAEFERFCCGSASSRLLPWHRAADEPVAAHACGSTVSATIEASPVREAA